MQQKNQSPYINWWLSVPPWKLFPIVLFIVAISYANSLYSPLVIDDVHSFIEEPNAYVNDISLDAIRQLANTKFGKSRLVPFVTFAFDHYLDKGNIVQYHLSNLVIHLLATTVLFLFLKAIFSTQVGRNVLRGLDPGLLILSACALWALNPVQTNAVTYIVQRMTSLAALFYLLALTGYIHGRTSSGWSKKFFFYLVFLLAALCAFFSKENTATLPLAVLLVEFMLLSPGLGGKLLEKLSWYHWIAIVCLVILLLPLAERPWHALMKGYEVRHFTLFERLLTEPRIVVYYLSLLLFPLPSRLNLDYDFTLSHSLFSPLTTVFSVILIFSLLCCAFYMRRRYPLISVGIIWFFLHLIIESTVIPLELAFEHRLYLPSVGFYIVLTGIICAMANYFHDKHLLTEFKQIFFLVMIIFISLSSVLTTLRNNDWLDSGSIYADAARKSPNKPRPYANLGMALGQAGRYEEAIQELEKAISLGRPFYEEYVNSVNNILLCMIGQGNYTEAEGKGEKYLKEMDSRVNIRGFPKLMRTLGSIYFNTGEYGPSFDAYISGLRHEQIGINIYLVSEIERLLLVVCGDETNRESSGLCNENSNGKIAMLLKMSDLMLIMKDYDKALKYIEKTIEVDPGNMVAQELLARYRDEIAKNQQGAELSDVANHLPYKTNKVYHLYVTLFEFIMNNYSPLVGPAEWLLARASNLEPSDPFLSYYYAIWFLKEKRIDSAIDELERLLQQHPDFIPGLELAGSTYLQLKNSNKAVEIFSHILDLYPGHAKWQYYQNIIAKVRDVQNRENKSKGGEVTTNI